MDCVLWIRAMSCVGMLLMCEREVVLVWLCVSARGRRSVPIPHEERHAVQDQARPSSPSTLKSTHSRNRIPGIVNPV